jgi:hypothetical protein
MKDRNDRALKPRVRPKMNTDTRRHDEKPSYHRKSKYKEDLLDDEELAVNDDAEDGGVLSDYQEEPEPEADEAPRRRRGGGSR